MYYTVYVRMKCNIKCSCAFVDESDTSMPAGDSTPARRREDVRGLGKSFSCCRQWMPSICNFLTSVILKHVMETLVDIPHNLRIFQGTYDMTGHDNKTG